MTFGVQFREGKKFFGFGEKIDAGVHKVIADAELLWSVETGFILNINFPESFQNFLDQGHKFRFGYSDKGFGGGVSGVYHKGSISEFETNAHIGPANLNVSPETRASNISFQIFDGARTIGMFSFSGSLSVNNVNVDVNMGETAADGMAINKTRRDGYLRMMRHNRYSNDGAAEKLRVKTKFRTALKKLK